MRGKMSVVDECLGHLVIVRMVSHLSKFYDFGIFQFHCYILFSCCPHHHIVTLSSATPVTLYTILYMASSPQNCLGIDHTLSDSSIPIR